MNTCKMRRYQMQFVFLARQRRCQVLARNRIVRTRPQIGTLVVHQEMLNQSLPNTTKHMTLRTLARRRVPNGELTRWQVGRTSVNLARCPVSSSKATILHP